MPGGQKSNRRQYLTKGSSSAHIGSNKVKAKGFGNIKFTPDNAGPAKSRACANTKHSKCNGTLADKGALSECHCLCHTCPPLDPNL